MLPVLLRHFLESISTPKRNTLGRVGQGTDSIQFALRFRF